MELKRTKAGIEIEIEIEIELMCGSPKSISDSPTRRFVWYAAREGDTANKFRAGGPPPGGRNLITIFGSSPANVSAIFGRFGREAHTSGVPLLSPTASLSFFSEERLPNSRPARLLPT